MARHKLRAGRNSALQSLKLSEVSQRKTNIISFITGESLKKVIQMNLLTKQKQTHRLGE